MHLTLENCLSHQHFLQKRINKDWLSLTNKESYFRMMKVTVTGVSDFHDFIGTFLKLQFC